MFSSGYYVCASGICGYVISNPPTRKIGVEISDKGYFFFEDVSGSDIGYILGLSAESFKYTLRAFRALSPRCSGRFGAREERRAN